MGLRQYEEKRGTVLAGKDLHRRHETENKSYVPTDIGGKKIIGLYLYSQKLGLSGRIDEVIDNGVELVLIEWKYSDHATISDTLRVQLGLLSLLLEENFKKPVTHARVIFAKNTRKSMDVQLDTSTKDFALKILHQVKETVMSGTEPQELPDGRCLDCCFRKICSVGSIYVAE